MYDKWTPGRAIFLQALERLGLPLQRNTIYSYDDKYRQRAFQKLELWVYVENMFWCFVIPLVNTRQSIQIYNYGWRPQYTGGICHNIKLLESLINR